MLQDLEKDESSLLGVPLDQAEYTSLIKTRAALMLEGDFGKLGNNGREGLPIANGSFSKQIWHSLKCDTATASGQFRLIS